MRQWDESLAQGRVQFVPILLVEIKDVMEKDSRNKNICL